MAVTPVPGTNSVVTTGGTAVVAVPANPNGGIITNGYTAADQGGIAAPEPLIVNPVGTAGTVGNGTNFALQPGQSWEIIAGQTTPTTVNAASNGHAFSVIYY